MAPPLSTPSIAEYRILKFLARKAEDGIIYNGSGGDALYCNYPSFSTLYDAAINGGSTFWKHCGELSTYWRLSRYQALTRAWKDLAVDRKIKDCRPDFLTTSYAADILESGFHNIYPTSDVDDFRADEITGTPAQRQRVRNAMQGLYEAITIPVPGVKIRRRYPFFENNVRNKAIRTPIFELIEDGHDRYPLRKSAELKYGKNAFWHRRKGSSTGATQRAFQFRLNEISERICDGHMAARGLLKKDALRILVYEVCMGVTPCPSALLDLMAVEVFMDYWNDRP